MKKFTLLEIDGNSNSYFILIAALGAMIALGLGSAYYMEHNGHYVTGMSNHIVWGVPHIFAIFLIVAASGALNVASIASVFGKVPYKPLAPLSAILSICLLVGGLVVLVLDLGRPDRLIVAMTSFNFKSIFAWNIFLYTGFIGIVGVYLWFMLKPAMNKYSSQVGLIAFVWRIILTTGTGSIFGFIISREAFNSALLGPMFVIMSFSFGLAVFLLVLLAAYKGTKRPIGDAIIYRLRNLLGVFVAAVMYMVIAFHLTKLYGTENHAVEAFILLEGGIYTSLFWYGQIILGSIVPLILFYTPQINRSTTSLVIGCFLVILGGMAQLYVMIIGAQAFPMTLIPGMEIVSSGFFDGRIVGYIPSLWEVLLGLGGIAFALVLVSLGVKILKILPVSLEDAYVDPHSTQAKA